MPRHPVACMYADRSQLAPLRPHPGIADISLASDAERRHAADQGLLHLPQVPVQVQLVALEIEDRVADELAGPMEGDIAASLDLEQLHASCGEQGGGGEQVIRPGRAAKRDDWWMLDEQQHVLIDGARNARSRDGTLQRQRLGVPARPQVANEQGPHAVSPRAARQATDAAGPADRNCPDRASARAPRARAATRSRASRTTPCRDCGRGTRRPAGRCPRR